MKREISLKMLLKIWMMRIKQRNLSDINICNEIRDSSRTLKVAAAAPIARDILDNMMT